MLVGSTFFLLQIKRKLSNILLDGSDCLNPNHLESKRSEPSSRITLNGEQPYPWELLHPRDVMSRHRGAELRRRYGRLGATSLLSPE